MSEEFDVIYDPANDYYRLLGIAANVDTDELRQVYRQRAKEFHPDRNPRRKEWASQQFKKINGAYAVLGDEELRAEYDRQRYFYLFDAFSTPPEPPKRPRPKSAAQRIWIRYPRIAIATPLVIIGFAIATYFWVKISMGQTCCRSVVFPTVALPTAISSVRPTLTALGSATESTTSRANSTRYISIPFTKAANCNRPQAQISKLELDPDAGLIVSGTATGSSSFSFFLVVIRVNTNALTTVDRSQQQIVLVENEKRLVNNGYLYLPKKPASVTYPNAHYVMQLAILEGEDNTANCNVEFTLNMNDP